MKSLIIAPYILLMTINAIAFGAPKILPANERSLAFEVSTKSDKKSSFKKILVWSAKSFANSNESIKMKDSDLGIFIAKGNIPCESLKIGNGYAKDQNLEFTLEFEVEDKLTKVKVSDLVGRANGAYDDASRPSTKKEMEQATNECINPFLSEIKSILSN